MSGSRARYASLPLCGCWFRNPNSSTKQYLPQVELDSHTTILATTSKTILRQSFHNPLGRPISEVKYTFPLYDGVSVGGFTCSVAGRVIVGVVKEKNQARVDYEDAKSKGQTAGLLEQNSDAADVFTTSIGNVPAGVDVLVEITYLGELKNDAETDGARFTIPTAIAPRYGASSAQTTTGRAAIGSQSMKITLDIMLEENCAIRGIQSPSHPIAVSMGTTSTCSVDDSFESNLGSATLALGSTELDSDFVVVISAKGQDTPRALLETHPTIPNQRALMLTLVPRFNIPNDNPEIVFVIDRSGSMSGKMHLVIDALKVFLKSLPIGVKFNICSFGSRHSFLFDKSRTYDSASLEKAMEHIDPRWFQANYMGTEMLRPVQDVIERRYSDLPLEVILLTDGEIWNQESLFKIVKLASTKNARFFTLGIGSQASSSLVEGIARAGRGFAQWVHDGERIDKRIVRMLKGALSPHIKYKLEVKYAPNPIDEDEFEIIESFEKSMKNITIEDTPSSANTQTESPKQISLFNVQAQDEPTNPPAGRFDRLPLVSIPNVLQSPHELPELYPHNRTTVYLLLGPEIRGRVPDAVIFRGSSTHGNLELEIAVQEIGEGLTFHKLAAKKATQELEEGRGWLTEISTANGKSLKSQNEGKWDLIVEREAVRLGTTFQVAGKFCSFVAVEKIKKDRPLDAQNVLEDLPSYRVVDDDEDSEEFEHAQGVASNIPGTLMSSSYTGLRRLSKRKRSGRRRRSRLNQFIEEEAEVDEDEGSIQREEDDYGGFIEDDGFDDFIEEDGPSPFLRNGSSHARQAPIPSPSIFGNSSFGHAQPQHSATTASLFGSAPSTTPAIGDGSVDRAVAQTQAARQTLLSKSPAVSRGAPRARAHAFAPSMAKNAPGALMGAFLFSTGDSQQQKQQAQMGRPSFVPTASLPALEKMQRLISLQSFAGSWSFSDDFIAIISHGAKTKIRRSGVIKLVTKNHTDQSDRDWVDDLDENDCATVLAIAWLETVMKEESDVWEMVVEKARGVLENDVGGSDRVEKLVDGVRNLWVVNA